MYGTREQKVQGERSINGGMSLDDLRRPGILEVPDLSDDGSSCQRGVQRAWSPCGEHSRRSQYALSLSIRQSRRT